MDGCGGSKAPTNASVGSCTLLAINSTAAPATPLDPGSGFVSALVLGPVLPPYCANLGRRVCTACSASKNPVGCAECTGRAANKPVWGALSVPGNDGHLEMRGAIVQLPGAIDDHTGCARCFNESATPSVCAEGIRRGARNSSCFGCVMDATYPPAERYSEGQKPIAGAGRAIDVCITCSSKFGRAWEEDCR